MRKGLFKVAFSQPSALFNNHIELEVLDWYELVIFDLELALGGEREVSVCSSVCWYAL